MVDCCGQSKYRVQIGHEYGGGFHAVTAKGVGDQNHGQQNPVGLQFVHHRLALLLFLFILASIRVGTYGAVGNLVVVCEWVFEV